MLMTRLLVVGKFPNMVSGLMQWVLLTVDTLYNEVGLSVSTDKTKLIEFTRKSNSWVSLNHIFWGYIKLL
jgi:hypothetical protein